jgi:predicted nucleic acid-binding protein
MLVDTDVIIWFLRGNQLAEARLNQIPKLRLSVITYMEFFSFPRSRVGMPIASLQRRVTY